MHSMLSNASNILKNGPESAFRDGACSNETNRGTKMQTDMVKGLNLNKAFLGFMVLGAGVFLAATLFFISNRVTEFHDSVVQSAIEVRTDHLALDIAMKLDNHWSDLGDLSVVIPFTDRVTFRSFLTREVADGTDVVWAGYVDTAGQVLLASRRQREGESVSTEDWFLRALAGPLMGYSRTSDGEERLVLSHPVAATGSTQAGILTLHLDPQSFEATLSELASSLGLDVVVFDERGMPVLHSFSAQYVDMTQLSVQRALSGQEVSTREVWRGLGERFAMSVPEIQTAPNPAVGWRMVTLASPSQFNEAKNTLMISLTEILGVMALVLLILSIGFIRVFLDPLHKLVINAQEIAVGDDVLPLENHRTTELSLLSSALARLQGRMLRAEDKVVELQEKLGTGVSADRS